MFPAAEKSVWCVQKRHRIPHIPRFRKNKSQRQKVYWKIDMNKGVFIQLTETETPTQRRHSMGVYDVRYVQWKGAYVLNILRFATL